MTTKETPRPQELTEAELKQAAGGVRKLPGMHKAGDITLKRGTF